MKATLKSNVNFERLFLECTQRLYVRKFNRNKGFNKTIRVQTQRNVSQTFRQKCNKTDNTITKRTLLLRLFEEFSSNYAVLNQILIKPFHHAKLSILIYFFFNLRTNFSLTKQKVRQWGCRYKCQEEAPQRGVFWAGQISMQVAVLFALKRAEKIAEIVQIAS